jgi:hypothetical protein
MPRDKFTKTIYTQYPNEEILLEETSLGLDLTTFVGAPGEAESVTVVLDPHHVHELVLALQRYERLVKE